MKMEVTLIKIKCTSDILGKDILIPATPKSAEDIKTIEYNQKLGTLIKYKGKHSIERHDLFWSCCALVAENIEGKTPSMIAEMVKIDARHIDYYTPYKDKYGKDRINIKTKSISFFDMTLQEANNFYKVAFDILAGYLDLETDKMIEEAKLHMKATKYCPSCGKKAVHKHHRFSQTAWGISKYGRKNIDACFNIVYYCPDCHTSHRNVLKNDLWDEKRFKRELEKYRSETCDISRD